MHTFPQPHSTGGQHFWFSLQSLSSVQQSGPRFWHGFEMFTIGHLKLQEIEWLGTGHSPKTCTNIEIKRHILTHQNDYDDDHQNDDDDHHASFFP